ncbi:hypothetical protein HDU88_007835 [Geranomyces variabilis]|nr:hypothetical protein HDU88_007835 [Geranomyces variabilis]
MQSVPFLQRRYPVLKPEAFAVLSSVPVGRAELKGPVASFREAVASDHNQRGFTTEVVENVSTLVSRLTQAGFKDDFASTFGSWLSDEFVPRRTVSQWWNVALARGSYADVAAQAVEATTTSASVPLPADQLAAPVRRTTHLNAFNKDAFLLELQATATAANSVVLFHGTPRDNLRLFEEIGINLFYCTANLDFHLRGAFYTTPQFGFVKAGAQRGTGAPRCAQAFTESAILVYVVPKEYMAGLRMHVFQNPDKDWQKFCFFNFTASTRQLVHAINRTVEVVHGPICLFRPQIGRNVSEDMLPYKLPGGRIATQYAFWKSEHLVFLQSCWTETILL